MSATQRNRADLINEAAGLLGKDPEWVEDRLDVDATPTPRAVIGHSDDPCLGPLRAVYDRMGLRFPGDPPMPETM